jgi:DNA-binding NarL/FixJ family response regulator
MDPMPVRVLIVDDQKSFRAAARALLEQRGFTIAGEAATPKGALEAAIRHEPDAVLMDVRLGEHSGFEAAWAIRRACPQAKILLVSAADYRHCRERMRACGARGFVQKQRLASVDLSQFWPIPDMLDAEIGKLTGSWECPDATTVLRSAS